LEVAKNIFFQLKKSIWSPCPQASPSTERHQGRKMLLPSLGSHPKQIIAARSDVIAEHACLHTNN
jgi:hypothetical protein